MTKLPQDWTEASIEEVADVIRGVTYSKSQTMLQGDDGSVPLLRATNIEPGYLTYEDMVYIPEKVVKPNQVLQVDDIILTASSGSISVVGKSAQVFKSDGETFGAFCAVIRPKRISGRFLSYWVQSPFVRDYWSSLAKGTNINNLKLSDIERTKIPLPSIAKQQEIVEILEDHLSRLDAALADVKTAAAKANTFRRSALISLVLGRYPAREGDFDNSECLSKIPRINDLDMGGGKPPNINLPVGWKWIQWKDAGDSQNGKAVPSSDYRDSGTRLLRPGNLYPNGTLVWNASNSRFLDSSYELKHPDYMLRPGNLVMNLTAQSLKGDFLGRTCLVKEEDESFLNQRLARLTPKVCSPEYALLVFTSPLFRAYVLSLNTGSLIQHMYTKQLAEFWLPLPPPETEKYIIQNSKFIFEALNSIFRQTESALSDFEVLKRSLLQAAFSGQLTREVTHV